MDIKKIEGKLLDYILWCCNTTDYDEAKRKIENGSAKQLYKLHDEELGGVLMKFRTFKDAKRWIDNEFKVFHDKNSEVSLTGVEVNDGVIVNVTWYSGDALITVEEKKHIDEMNEKLELL